MQLAPGLAWIKSPRPGASSPGPRSPLAAPLLPVAAIALALGAAGCATSTASAPAKVVSVAPSPIGAPAVAATPAPPVSPSAPTALSRATPEECALLHIEAQLRVARRQRERARAALELGRRRCPDDGSFASELGDFHAVAGDVERAADHYIAAVTGPDPPEAAFQHLARIYERLRPATRDRIRALGGTVEAPLFVPSIGYEYAWIAAFACTGGQGRVAEQVLVAGRQGGGQLDRLHCLCPDGSDRSLYFDFSADPHEREMKSQLRQMLEAEKASRPSTPSPRRKR